MSVQALQERLLADPSKAEEWRTVREEIHDLLDGDVSDRDREFLMQLFTVVMDWVERCLAERPELEHYRKIRRCDYVLLLTKASLVGENVSADLLEAVTAQEVASGRMAPDDELRLDALEAKAQPHYSVRDLKRVARRTSPTRMAPKDLLARQRARARRLSRIH